MTYLGPTPSPGSMLKGKKTRKSPARRNKQNDHLAYIRLLPCLYCDCFAPCDAAHIRFASVEFGKRDVGGGEKPDDEWTVPLCRKCHTKQHSMDEQDFWNKKFIKPLSMALRLFVISGDVIEGTRIIKEIKRRLK